MRSYTLAILFIVLLVGTVSAGTTGRPVVVIPGIFGSAIYERTPPNPPPNKCGRTKETDNDLAWIAITRLVDGFTCLKDALTYDYTGDDSNNGKNMYTTKDAYIVDTIQGSKGMAYLDPDSIWKMPYGEPLFEELEATGKWERDANLVAFAYDWRVTPLNWADEGGLFDQMEEAIVNAYDTYGHRVLLLTHSNGGPLFLSFMNHVNEKPEYLDPKTQKPMFGTKYLHKVALFAPALGGSVESFQSFIGESTFTGLPDWLANILLPSFFEGLPGISYLILRPEAHTVMPLPLLTVKSTGETFGYTQVIDAIRKLGTVSEHVLTHYEYTSQFMHADTPAVMYPAGVSDLYVFYGTATPTPSSFEIKDWPKPGSMPSRKTTNFSKGDGTMLAATIEYYLDGFKAASRHPDFCFVDECKITVTQTELSHIDVFMNEGKHKTVSTWIFNNEDL